MFSFNNIIFLVWWQNFQPPPMLGWLIFGWFLHNCIHFLRLYSTPSLSCIMRKRSPTIMDSRGIYQRRKDKWKVEIQVFHYYNIWFQNIYYQDTSIKAWILPKNINLYKIMKRIGQFYLIEDCHSTRLMNI